MDSIGKRIRYARKKKNLTLTDIKNLTGLSTGNLSELENDKFAPSANALIALRKILDVSIDWILTGEETGLGGNQMNYLIKEEKTNSYPLTHEEQELVENYRKLSEAKKRDILGFIRVSVYSQKNHQTTEEKSSFFGNYD